MAAQQFHRKPVPVEAVQWTGGNESELVVFAHGRFEAVHPDDRGDDPEQTGALLDHHSAWTRVYTGQWIVKDPEGRFSAVDEVAFAEEYEPVQGACRRCETSHGVGWPGTEG